MAQGPRATIHGGAGGKPCRIGLMRRPVTKWLGIAAQLYVLFNVIFFVSNVATIVLIRGPGVLSAEALFQIFARGAMICIGFAIAGTVITVLIARSFRKPQAR